MEEVVIKVPETWADVSLKKYQKFYTAVKPYKNSSEFSNKVTELAAYYLCDIDADALYKLPIDVHTEISQLLNQLFTSGGKQQLVKTFELAGTRYGFIPNLEKITYGEYCDLVTYSKDAYENAATLCTILYRPIVEENKGKYRIENYKGTEEDTVELLQEKLTMDIVFGAIGFFLRLQQELLSAILLYSTEQMKKLNKKETLLLQETLAKSGVSTQQLQQLLEMTQQNLKTSYDSMFTPY